MRAAIYIRVSTEEQAKEGYSIPAQRDRLTQFVLSQGWEIAGYYVDDGYSAKDMDRPELQRLLQDIADGQVDIVVVYRLDRLTRNVSNLDDLLRHFEKHKVGLKSATELFDTTTAAGRLFLYMVAVLAQWERENLGERVRMGLEEKVLQGGWHGSTPPFGYDLGEDGKLVINEREANVVRKMYELYINGMGDNKITVWLNKQGYTTKAGFPWSHTTVRYVLTNPIYIGNLRWNFTTNGDYMEIENAVPAIIDRNVFEQAQKLREARAHTHPRQATSTYIFSGRVRCGRCGAALKGKTTRVQGATYKHYICANKRAGLCNLPRIEEGLLERTFLKYIEHLSNETEAKQVVATADNTAEIQESIKAIKNELQRIHERKKRWQLAYADGVITLEDLRERTKEDKAREEELRKQLEELEQSLEKTYEPQMLLELLRDLRNNWDAAEPNEKKTMLQIIVKSITVDTPYDRMPAGKFTKRPDPRVVEIKDVDFN